MTTSLSMLDAGVQLLRVGRFTLAARLLRDAVAAEPHNPAVHHSLALALRACGDLTGARAAVETAVHLNGDASRSWALLADVCWQLADQDAAADAWQKADPAVLSEGLRNRMQSQQQQSGNREAVALDEERWVDTPRGSDAGTLAQALHRARCAVVVVGELPSTRRGQRQLWSALHRDAGASVWRFRESPSYLWSILASWMEGEEPQPGAVHRALAALPVSAVLTLDVDGLHEDAGCERVVALHGSVRRTRCDGCGQRYRVPVKGYLGGPLPPRCGCGAPLRPDALLSGETVDAARLAEAADWMSRADLVVLLGCDRDCETVSAVLAAPSQATVLSVRPADVLAVASMQGEVM